MSTTQTATHSPIGSTLESWLDEEGIKHEVYEAAMSERPTETAAAKLADDAHAEAVRRYAPSGDVEGALIFYRLATSFPGKVTDDDVLWARKAMNSHGR